MKQAIEMKNVVKAYDSGFRLGELNITIPSGVIVGLIGENGAGKTTMIKSLLNVIRIDQGTIRIFEQDHQQQESKIKEDIGVVLDQTFFPELLTPKEINSIMKEIYSSWDQELFFQYLKDFSLPVDKQIRKMSKGMRKKLEIATALAHHPKLLLLDEPTSGLDPVVRNEVLDLFLDFIQEEDHTILFSTHITSDLEHIADQIIFIDQGNILLNQSRDELLDSYGILKCPLEQMDTIDTQDYIAYKKNRYDAEFLVTNRRAVQKKYTDSIVDPASLEDLMVFMIKGVRK